MFGCVLCKMDILLWSGRGIASYALTLRCAGAEEGADTLPSPPNATSALSAYRRSRLHLGWLPHAPRAICMCMCKCFLCPESQSAWHHGRRFLSLCTSSQQSCRTLFAGPRMPFRTWPNTHRLTGLCNKTAWSRDNRPLK